MKRSDYVLALLLAILFVIVVHNLFLPAYDGWFTTVNLYGSGDPHHKNFLGQ